MTRSLAPRPRTPRDVWLHELPRKRPPPDPNAIFHWICCRCTRPFWARGIATECIPCTDHALKAFELGPIRGEISGT